MSRSSHCALDLAHHETNMTAWPPRIIAALPWRVLAALPTMWDALREGIGACRQYERLRSRRVPHGPAIRAALGIGFIPRR